ncbi:MAG: hypothetical protein HRT89_18270, partial [Lentisphaeria bacterium]|nr:ATP-binding protein [Lentisphaeria bacterium]NQZ70004.1 hypothetical protein [Lentisphaeria bacterium]
MSSFGNQLSNGSESEKDMMIAQLHEEVSALKEILKDAIATKPATAQALHVQQQRAEELIESSPWLVFWVDARGFYREVNKQFCDFLHMSSQEVLDSKLGNLGEAPEFYDPIQSFIDSTKTSLTTEISMLINGVTNYFLLIMRKSETSDQSSVIGIDITARVILKNEKVRDQRLESVGTLAGGIAHDFNNILTVIQGNASIGLMSVDEEDEAFELFTEVENASKRAQKLTHQLLTFSKGGAPVISLSPLPILIEDAVQFTSRGSACKFDYNFEDGLCLGIIDCNQISQVIQNIAMNAIQAMSQKGTVSISASNISEGNSTYPMLDPGIFIEIKIEDTGIGIAAVDLPLIFDPYYSTNEGPGLGLAVAHSIVQKHGGHLLVESELG